jgi:phthiodiolone/phenolphthiodiolone dimycocerosates ketoreductase
LTGTLEEVVDQAAEWRDHGVRYIVVCNISFLQPNLRRGLSANIPFIKVRRRLKRL